MTLQQFEKELHNAICKYGDNHIDISVNSETEEVYAYYHSTSNSFSVTETYGLKALGGIDKVKEYENVYTELCVLVD